MKDWVDRLARRLAMDGRLPPDARHLALFVGSEPGEILLLLCLLEREWRDALPTRLADVVSWVRRTADPDDPVPSDLEDVFGDLASRWTRMPPPWVGDPGYRSALVWLQRDSAREPLVSLARTSTGASALRDRIQTPLPPFPDPDLIRPLLAACTTGSSESLDPIQKAAPLLVCLGGLVALAGGPGTGKTTVVASLLRFWRALHPRIHPSKIALTAPTGRAKARLLEGVSRHRLPHEADELEAQTLHTLLEAGRDGRFLRDSLNPLDCSLVVVDEASMMSRSLFEALLEAIPRDALVVLVGDPRQLPPVDAVPVLPGLLMPTPDTNGAIARWMGEVTGIEPDLLAPAIRASPIPSITLQRSFRSVPGLVALSEAVRAGCTEDALTLLANPDPSREMLPPDLPEALRIWQRRHPDDLAEKIHQAREGDPSALLAWHAGRRILCVRREGRGGVEDIHRLLGHHVHGAGMIKEIPEGWPVLQTINRHDLNLWNGDLGVLVHRDGVPYAVFDSTTGPRWFAAQDLPGLLPAHAITVHKSQGAEFDEVLVVVPNAARLPGRSLFYTAFTRARRWLGVVNLSGERMASALAEDDLAGFSRKDQ